LTDSGSGAKAASCSVHGPEKILCPGKEIIELSCIGSHNMMNQIAILENHPNLDFELEVTVKSISGGTATYTDAKGTVKTISADSFLMRDSAGCSRVCMASKSSGEGGIMAWPVS